MIKVDHLQNCLIFKQNHFFRYRTVHLYTFLRSMVCLSCHIGVTLLVSGYQIVLVLV